MYDESRPHKEDLRRNLKRIEARIASVPEDGMQTTILAMEKFVFWAAFVMRKLADSHKLSDDMSASLWEVERYPKVESRRFIDRLNCHRLDKNYDLGCGEHAQLRPRQICGMLLHSLVFMPISDEDGRSLIGFFSNSDKTKDQVYMFLWKEFRGLIEALVADDVVAASYDRITGVMVKEGPGAVARRG
jgi:hypothetical protein